MNSSSAFRAVNQEDLTKALDSLYNKEEFKLAYAILFSLSINYGHTLFIPDKLDSQQPVVPFK